MQVVLHLWTGGNGFGEDSAALTLSYRLDASVVWHGITPCFDMLGAKEWSCTSPMDNHQICTIFGLGHPKTKRVQFADIPFYVIPRWLQYKCLARMWWVRVFPSIYVISIYSVLYVQYSIYLYLIVFVYVDVCVCECLYMYLYMSYVSVCIYVDMFHSLVFLAQLKPIVKHGEGLWAADEDPQGGRPWWLIVQLISNDRGSKRLLRHFSTETVGGKQNGPGFNI